METQTRYPILRAENKVYSTEKSDLWRYAPKFEDGKAVIAKNRTVQLDYKLAP